MTQIKNNINTYADLTAYNADTNKDFPNVSYIEGTDEVKWNKYDPDHIVCVYDVTSTSEATKLLFLNSGISYQIIDGVQQQSVQTTYTFDTLGKHTVKYKLTGTVLTRQIFRGLNITSATIPYGITEIEGSFYGCQNLKTINIPNSVTSITIGGFTDCYVLKNVIIPNSMITIDDQAFNNCKAFTNVTIPSGVTRIGVSAFRGCTSLTSVTVEATTPPTLATEVFNNTNNCPIYVPAESVEAYKAATNWSTYASRIQAIPTT